MSTEVIGVEIREDGSRVVARNFEALAESADRAQSGVESLQNEIGKLNGQRGSFFERELNFLKSQLGEATTAVSNLKTRMETLKAASPREVAATFDIIAISAAMAEKRIASLTKAIAFLKPPTGGQLSFDLVAPAKAGGAHFSEDAPRDNHQGSFNFPRPVSPFMDNTGFEPIQQEMNLGLTKINTGAMQLEGTFKAITNEEEVLAAKMREIGTIGQQAFGFMYSMPPVVSETAEAMKELAGATKQLDLFLDNGVVAAKKVQEVTAETAQLSLKGPGFGPTPNQGTFDFMKTLPNLQAATAGVQEVAKGAETASKAVGQLSSDFQRLEKAGAEFEQAMVTSQRRVAQAVRYAQEAFEAARTPAERYRQVIAMLYEPEVRAALSTDQFNAALRRAQSELKATAVATDTAGFSTSHFVRQLFYLQIALQMVVGFLFLRELKEYADTWTSVTNNIRVSTSSTEEATAVQNALFDVTQRTRGNLEDTVTLYRRTQLASQNLGASQADIVKFVEGVNMAMAVQGTSVEAARGSLLQLGQLLGMAKIRMQEFTSISENAPLLLMTIAKNIDDKANPSLVKLRQNIEAQNRSGGKIDVKKALEGIEETTIGAKEFFAAFMKGWDEIKDKFDKVQPTIAQGFNYLHNALIRYVGELNQAAGASTAFVGALHWLGDNLATIGKLVLTGIAGALIIALPLLKSMIVGAIGGLVGIAGPIFSILAVIGMAVTAILLFRDSIVLSQKEGITLGDVFVTAWEKAKKFFGLGQKSVEEVTSINKTNQHTFSKGQSTPVADLPYGEFILEAAEKFNVSAELIASVIKKESNFNQTGRNGQTLASDKGALGLMQLLPGTARDLGVNPHDARENIMGGTHYLAQQLERFGGDVEKTLAAYNAGPGAVLKAGGIPNFHQTQDYVQVILADYTARLAALQAKNPPPAQEETPRTARGGYNPTSLAGMMPDESKWASSLWNPKNIGRTWDDLKTHMAETWEEIKQGIDTVVGFFRFLSNAPLIILDGFPRALSDIFARAFNAVMEIVEGSINWIIEKFNGLLGRFGSILPQAMQGLKMDYVKMPTIDPGSDKDGVKDLGKRLEEAWKLAMSARGVQEAIINPIKKAFTDFKEEVAQTATKRHDKGTVPELDKNHPYVAMEGMSWTAGEISALTKSYDQLLSSMDPILAAQLKLAEGEKLLNVQRALGNLSSFQYNVQLQNLRAHYKDALDPLGAMIESLDEEYYGLQLTGDARKAYMRTMELEKELTRKIGHKPETDEELAALELIRKAKERNIELTKIQNERDRITDKMNRPKLDAQLTNEVADSLVKEGKITPQQGKQEKIETNLNAGIGSFSDGFLKQLDVLSDKATNWSAHVGTIFGDMVKGISSKWGDAFARMIVYGENLGDAMGNLSAEILSTLIGALIQLGIQYALSAALGQGIAQAASTASVATALIAGPAIAEAYAPAAAMVSLATFGSNSIAASAGLIETMGLAKILASAGGEVVSLASGGYTGNLATDQVAGIVHGQEFVMNASATAKYRPLLESMNSGHDPGSSSKTGGSSGDMNVTVHNYSSASISAERISASEVRIIAREVASETVHREAPSAVARDLTNPNSRVSKAIGQNTNTTRKR